ncbi:hypothetical protein [uncultured Phascolarctobacterium sp.]|uniref:hypothetical protein n=1 Tax=uncultured Phascolarctobacterium sp. TaxID=512296 RepID=UPI0025DCE55C|nr:hypothetical protein [uncultured Phascolarctobacterium sp.]
MRKKFLAAALALGVSFFGGWGRAQAEYYEMYNPQTGVAGCATIYDTTCGTILEFFVHTLERNEDVYCGETSAVGVVYCQPAGERYIRNLQVTSLESLKNGMGYPSRYRYIIPLYEKDGLYPSAAPGAYAPELSGRLYGTWIAGEPLNVEKPWPSLAGTYNISSRQEAFVQGETEMPCTVARVFLQLAAFPHENVMHEDAMHFSMWDYQWEQEMDFYQGVDKSYRYYAFKKCGHPDKSIQEFKDARYLVEVRGREIYNVADDGTVRRIYDLDEALRR